MLSGAKDPVSDTVSDIKSVIAKGAQKPKRAQRSASDQPKDLPKKLAKDVARLEANSRNARFVPYRTAQEEKQAKAVERRVRAHFKKRPDRGAAVKTFLATYILNLFYFAFALVAFWYVATQL